MLGSAKSNGSEFWSIKDDEGEAVGEVWGSELMYWMDIDSDNKRLLLAGWAFENGLVQEYLAEEYSGKIVDERTLLKYDSKTGEYVKVAQ